MSNKYKELKNKQQIEYDKFPKFYAFSNEQFREGMKKLGLDENQENEILSYGGMGLYIKKEDKEELESLFTRQKNELKEEIKNDKTGEGFIKDMFSTELANHEYGYTGEIKDTLDSLGLTYDDIEENDNLLNGLNLAKKQYSQENMKDCFENVEDELEEDEDLEP